MRIKVTCREVNKYQQESGECMSSLSALYSTLVTAETKRHTWWTRFKISLRWSLSLRMFDKKEYLLDGDILQQAKTYRIAWHDYWSVKNQMVACFDTDGVLYLDELESEIILRLRNYKELHDGVIQLR